MSISLADLPPHARAQAVEQMARQRTRPLAAVTGRWGRAKPTTVDGIRFRSATEARVYARLREELLAGEKLVIDCRFPLVATAARIGKAAKAGYITIDFTVWGSAPIGWVLSRAYDAKPANRAARSRDWRRGARAFTATYGITIFEVDR